MKKLRCKLDYHDFNNRELIKFCTQVSNGIYNDTDEFATPVVTKVVFTTTFTNYTDSVARYENAPKIEKAAMEQARKEMIDVLDLLRLYVDQLVNGNESLIHLSGFVPTKATIEKSSPLVESESFDVKRTTNLGEVTVVIHKTIGNEPLWYLLICSTSSNLPADCIEDGIINTSLIKEDIIINFTHGRTKVFSKLPTGVMYYFYVVSANTVSVSPLSSPIGIQL